MQKITSITEHLKGKECKMVFGVLHAATRMHHQNDSQIDSKSPKSGGSGNRQPVFNTLRRWKQIDIQITEAFNEAKDNVKYLTTLEKFIEPLYTGTPEAILDSLPALMNAVKMMQQIARYYNTTERMTNLFMKITNQMIINCKDCIRGGDEEPDKLWEKDPLQLIRSLESCLRMNNVYQEQYRITKDKLLTLPKVRGVNYIEGLNSFTGLNSIGIHF
jgi:dynein heavy chain, axonemal